MDRTKTRYWVLGMRYWFKRNKERKAGNAGEAGEDRTKTRYWVLGIKELAVASVSEYQGGR